MASIIEICNLALQNISQRTITSLDARTNEGKQCAQRYEHARDVTLQMSWWGFAKGVAALPNLDAAPVEWAYAYQLPPDLIACRYIVSPVPRQRVPFEQSGRELWTNHGPETTLAYTKRVVDPTQFSPLFIDALSWRIAADIAVPLTGSKSSRRDALGTFGDILKIASSSDANEQGPVSPLETVPDWIEGRG